MLSNFLLLATLRISSILVRYIIIYITRGVLKVIKKYILLNEHGEKCFGVYHKVTRIQINR